MAREKIYVCIGTGGVRTLERIATDPTEATHGSRFICAVGPFRTLRGARYFAAYGNGNPHVLTVEDAERGAKREAARVRRSIGQSVLEGASANGGR
jgi:hypothetical protein